MSKNQTPFNTIPNNFKTRVIVAPHVHLGAFSTGLIPERVEGEEGEGMPRRGNLAALTEAVCVLDS